MASIRPKWLSKWPVYLPLRMRCRKLPNLVGANHESRGLNPDEYQGELMGDLNGVADKYKEWKQEVRFA